MSTSPATQDDLRSATREIIDHFSQSQGAQNERLDAMAEDIAKIKVAVIDLLATDRHLHNLVRELKAHKIPLDEAKIFAQ